MEQTGDEPKRVTPTEARAKLLRSLVVPPPEDKREKHTEARSNSIRQMLQHDETNSG